MRKINYGLIVSDFDGTLIDDNQRVPQKVKKAIEEYVAAGGIFAVCTGRMTASILPRVRSLGLKGLVIAYQGTQISDIESGKLIKDGGFLWEEAAEICELIEGTGQFVNAYCGDTVFTDIPKDNVYLRQYERIVGIDAVSVKPISEHIRKNKLKCQKIASLISHKDRDWLYRFLKEKVGERFDVTCSAKVLVEVSPLGDTKGEALKYLASHYNIPMSKTVAIGDNLNDLSMVEAAAVGVATGNADEELKRRADLVSVTNNEGAVAEIIEKYGFA